MTIENLVLNGQAHTLFSENKTMSKFICQRLKCLLPSILKLFEEIFACKLNCLKQSLILMSLSFYSIDHRRISLPHPLPFESVF